MLKVSSLKAIDVFGLERSERPEYMLEKRLTFNCY